MLPPLYQPTQFFPRYAGTVNSYISPSFYQVPEVIPATRIPYSEYIEQNISPSANLVSEIASKIPSSVKQFVNRFIPKSLFPRREQTQPTSTQDQNHQTGGYEYIPKAVPATIYGPPIPAPVYGQPTNVHQQNPTTTPKPTGILDRLNPKRILSKLFPSFGNIIDESQSSPFSKLINQMPHQDLFSQYSQTADPIIDYSSLLPGFSQGIASVSQSALNRSPYKVRRPEISSKHMATQHELIEADQGN